jgi:arabinose-5-phosphate isomerase
MSDARAVARAAIETEIGGLSALAAAMEGPLGTALAEVVALVRAAERRVVVTGMGKSGHVGRKIAATLSSTGTPAYFVHPGEASHGDLGVIQAADVVLAISWSGETRELADIVAYTRRFSIPLVAMTSAADSTLAGAADIALVLPRMPEACPNQLAPTTSTTMQLALGDALAMALLDANNFSSADFGLYHPGGKLGAQLRKVADLMHRDGELPLVRSGETMQATILEMTAKRFGCAAIIDEAGRMIGIVTDGDLRRVAGPNLLAMTVDQVMSRQPRTIGADRPASEALATMNAARITVLFVTEGGKPVGIVHMHDLLRVGVA